VRRLLPALLTAVAFGGTAPAEAIAPPARVQVAATEFNFALSRASIKSGRALVELANYGEDPHNLRLQRVGGRRVYALGIVAPDESKVLSAKLLPGTFRLWCSIADHRARGMHATLIVRR
jgi:plastocyanin